VVWTSALIAAGNTVESAGRGCARDAVRRWPEGVPDRESTLRVAALAGFASTTVGASIGAATLSAAGLADG